MTTFPLTESLGLKVEECHTTRRGRIDPMSMTFDEATDPLGVRIKYVAASDLEAILEKAQRVYGCKDKTTGLWGMYEQPAANDTHSALLINIQPIQRKVEFETRVFNKMALGSGQMIETASHIEKSELDPFVGKKVRVTIEEVK